MTTMGRYDQGLSRQYPGLFVILLDQSTSSALFESNFIGSGAYSFLSLTGVIEESIYDTSSCS